MSNTPLIFIIFYIIGFLISCYIGNLYDLCGDSKEKTDLFIGIVLFSLIWPITLLIMTPLKLSDKTKINLQTKRENERKRLLQEEKERVKALQELEKLR